MITLASDDIFHNTLWMIFVLAVGAALLMLAFILVTRCARWCHRSMVSQRVDQSSRTWPQM